MDKNIDSLAGRAKSDYGITYYTTQETQFNHDFFESDRKASIFLMKDNYDKRSPNPAAYFRWRMGQGPKPQVAEDADEWVEKLMNPDCKCGL